MELFLNICCFTKALRNCVVLIRLILLRTVTYYTSVIFPGKDKWKVAAPKEELETLIVCPVSTADKELEVHMANIAKLVCTTPKGHCFG